MERSLIRSKWRVTIPKGVRRSLNLFEGQVLNWEVIEEEGTTEIRLVHGSLPRVEDMAAFKEAGARAARRKARQKKAGAILGKWAGNKGREKLKELVREVMAELLARMPTAPGLS
jgi:bifunctional DNA-binding transcriptional regulator/antitoxin component of YhaV-PrlF toxin-antitoxin module